MATEYNGKIYECRSYDGCCGEGECMTFLCGGFSLLPLPPFSALVPSKSIKNYVFSSVLFRKKQRIDSKQHKHQYEIQSNEHNGSWHCEI